MRFALEDARVAGPLVRERARAGAEPRPRARHRHGARPPELLPAPELAVRLALGEAAEAVLASQRVVPRKALALGYRFRFPALEAALRDLLGRAG